MTGRPRVSVVIAFLDSERFLPGAVESVFRQTFSDWELLLVDGGSRDGSAALARELERRHPAKVRALRRRGRGILGISQSRALGARRARAPLVALLDSDDEWDPRILERHEAAYREHLGRRAGMVYCPSIFLWESRRAPDRPKGLSGPSRPGGGRRGLARLALQATPRPGLHEPPSLLPEFLEAGYVKTPTTTSSLMDRRILLAAPAVPAEVGRHILEDMYLWFYVALRFPVFVSSTPLCWYRRHPESNSACLMAQGRLPAERRRHLRWLRRHILESGRSDRRELARLLPKRGSCA